MITRVISIGLAVFCLNQARAEVPAVLIVKKPIGEFVLASSSPSGGGQIKIPAQHIRANEPVLAKRGDRVKIDTLEGIYWVSIRELAIEERQLAIPGEQQPHALIGGGRGFGLDR